MKDVGPHRGGYPPIRDYAAIGDCHGFALVSRDGSIDWCTLDRFDADPVFCRMLDQTRGGFLSVKPIGPYRITRAYLPGTNILSAEFETATGVARVTDFMPVGRGASAGVYDYVSLTAPGWLVRRIEVLSGHVVVEIGYRPSVAFARKDADLRGSEHTVEVEDGPSLYSSIPLRTSGAQALGRAEIRAGETRDVVLGPAGLRDPLKHVDALLATTRAFWEEWIGFCRYNGPYEEAVRRSALVLKLLTYAPTGAIVAAPTTSLPETIGGDRNWDYRFCWVRDASLTLHALASLGYSGEAERFFKFLTRSYQSTRPQVQLMYGIGGEQDLKEHQLDHLEGYLIGEPLRLVIAEETLSPGLP